MRPGEACQRYADHLTPVGALLLACRALFTLRPWESAMTEMPTPETLEFAWLASTGSAPVLGPADGVVQPELAPGDAPLCGCPEA